MKKGVMMILVLAGLIEMGTIQAMGDITVGETKPAVYSGYYGSVRNNKETRVSDTLHVKSSYGNLDAVFPSTASRQQSVYLRKTLKGYTSMKRTSYLNELMQLV